MQPVTWMDADNQRISTDKNVVRRHARARESVPYEVVKIPSPKQPPQPPQKPNLLMMLPTIVMALSTGVITFIANQGSTLGNRAVFSIIPMILMGMMMMSIQMWSYRSSVKKHRADVEQQEMEYQNRLQAVRDRLERFAGQQQRILNQESPSVNELVKRSMRRDKTVWERQPGDNDFLAVRLGLGKLPISVEIRPPDQDDDPRLRPAHQIAEEFAFVNHLPIITNLNRLGTVGVRGQRPSDALYLAFTMIANIVVQHSPDEVYLYVFSHRPDASDTWGWLRWLPHTNTLHNETGGAIRLSFGSETDEELLLELSQMLRQRQDEKRQGRRLNPHLVLIFDETPHLQSHPVLGLLLEHDPKEDVNRLQASAIFVENPIPNQVNAMIQVQGGELTYRETWAADANQVHHRGMAELTTPKQMDQLARSMAPLRTEASFNAGSHNLPGSVRLVELLGATQPDQIDFTRLYSPFYDPQKVMAFPVGLNVDLKPQMVILRETGQGGHGSHAMLAGMTGTGKSVLLQAMVLSLALTNSPAHLNFILADFKGGASELAKLQGLPHLAGFVTDLNPAMVERFRIALESEVRRRKELFDTAVDTLGQPVANIRSYNKLCPEQPLPHLVVLLDEFAHGLNINPNFRGAIDTIAAQGRALGVHLILSTQRAADFDARIRPNIDVRLSLRVASREDSKTMFNRDEAFTRLTRPGQAYLQVGDNEVFEIFQAARADIPYQPEGMTQLDLMDSFAIYRVGKDGRRQFQPLYAHKSQQAAKAPTAVSTASEAEILVRQISDYCQERYSQARQICLPPLKPAAEVPLLSLLADQPVFQRWQSDGWQREESDRWLRLPLGMLDLPAEQEQRPYILDFNQSDGHLLLVGPPSSGKVPLFLRGLLLGLAMTHTPVDVNFYILSQGTGLALFAQTPHCQGNLIRPAESERQSRLFAFLQAEVGRRRSLMLEAQVDTMAALRRARPDLPLPAIFLIFEEYAAFKAANELPQPERLIQVQSWLQEGKQVDLHVIMSTSDGRSVNRLLDNMQNRVVLGGRAGDYQDVLGNKLAILPEIPGRGYTVVDQTPLELQIGTPGKRETLATLVSEMARQWDGYRPATITELPKYVELTSLWPDGLPAIRQERQITAPVGLVYDALQPVEIDLSRLELLQLIVGPPESGKTELLLSFCLAAAAAIPPEQLRILVLAFRQPSLLQGLKGLPHVQFVGHPAQARNVLPALVNNLKERATALLTEQEQMVGQTGFLSRLRPQRTLIVIDDFASFLQAGDDLLGLVDQCLDQGSGLGINLILSGMAHTFNQAKIIYGIRFKFLGQAVLQSSGGVVLSAEQNDLTLLNLQLEKSLQIPLHAPKIGHGRGFFASQGRRSVVQFARFGANGMDERERLDCLKELAAKIKARYEGREEEGGTAVFPVPTTVETGES